MSNLTIYFKSGNKVTIDKVVTYEVVEHKLSTSFTIGQESPNYKLAKQSLDMDSVECIIEH